MAIVYHTATKYLLKAPQGQKPTHRQIFLGELPTAGDQRVLKGVKSN